jgi:hypothetical protein
MYLAAAPSFYLETDSAGDVGFRFNGRKSGFTPFQLFDKAILRGAWVDLEESRKISLEF